MDEVLGFFTGLCFLLLLVILGPFAEKEDEINRINKYVFEHDYNLSRSEHWDSYLDGEKVDILGLDLNNEGYCVVFDGYNKIVIITSKKRYNRFTY